MKKITTTTLFFLLTLFTVQAQQTYKVISGKNMIKGTSSLHDWQSVVEKQTGTASINTGGTLEIQSLNVNMATKSIRSVKTNGSYYDGTMDKNTYKALEADKHPEISYQLKSISNVKTDGNTSNFNATGNLTIAGKTNPISFPVKATVNGDKITFTGFTKFKMSSYGITPPTAVLGTIKTGDEITIVINTTYSK